MRGAIQPDAVLVESPGISAEVLGQLHICRVVQVFCRQRADIIAIFRNPLYFTAIVEDVLVDIFPVVSDSVIAEFHRQTDDTGADVSLTVEITAPSESFRPSLFVNFSGE